MSVHSTKSYADCRKLNLRLFQSKIRTENFKISLMNPHGLGFSCEDILHSEGMMMIVDDPFTGIKF